MSDIQFVESISREIFLLNDLTTKQKILLRLVASFQNGCYYSNQQYADLLQIRPDSVSALIGDMLKKGYITRKLQTSKSPRTLYATDSTKALFDPNRDKSQTPLGQSPNINLNKNKVSSEGALNHYPQQKDEIKTMPKTTENYVEPEVLEQYHQLSNKYPNKQGIQSDIQVFIDLKISSHEVQDLNNILDHKAKNSYQWSQLQKQTLSNWLKETVSALRARSIKTPTASWM
jgi:DNA-binding CsgD family transcriptional regulator